jgi:two-component system CheB/CheR fusion protein
MSRDPTAQPPSTSSLVIIGGPADGVDALVTVIERLPPDIQAPIVIAQHLDPRHPIQLGDVLAARLGKPVVVVQDEQVLRPGSIFVGPSSHDIEVGGSDDTPVIRPVRSSLPSIDRPISTAARAFADQLIAVILHGAGIDGFAGAQAVKAYGGTVVAQSQGAPSLLGSAPSSLPAAMDIVADIEAIGPVIGDLLAGDHGLTTDAKSTEVGQFLDRIRDQTGIDFSVYKRPTIERRLRRRMSAVGTPTFTAYRRFVDRNPDELHELVSSFLIKVTDFFRDPDMFTYLRDRVLPALIEQARSRDGELRIWSAGCATGEEAYTVAMLVADLLGDDLNRLPVRIFATDVAHDAIDFARRGSYPPSALTDVPPELIERYFVHVDGSYEVGKAARNLLVFGEHDLGRRAPFPRINLVLCRNVLIYFTSDLQRRVLQRFAFSLRPEGYLVLGTSESVSPLPDFFTLEDSRLKIFRRGTAVAPMVPDSGRALARPTTALPGAGRRPQVRRVIPPIPSTSVVRTLAEHAIAVLDRLSVGVIVVDRQYDIRAINVAARRMLGIRGAGLDEDLIHLVAPPLSESLRALIDAAVRGELGSATHTLPPDVSTEHSRNVVISCAPVPIEGAGDSAIMVQIEITDITEYAARLHDVEAERGQLQAELDEMRIRTNAGSAAVRELGIANDSLAAELGRLRAENEQLQLAQEEAQAVSEEIETLNEEQQAANEELETLNEELQAANEELNASNSELEARTAQLESLTLTLEERRRESEEWFRAILEEASDYAIFTTDAANRINSWTPGAQAVLGWTTEEAIGQAIDVTFTPEDRQAGVPEQEFMTARDQGYAPDVRWHVRKDGTQVFIEGSSRARHAADGTFTGLLKIGRDVTDRHRADHARQESEELARQGLEARVEDATAELRELSRRLLSVQEEERRFLANELHDEIGQVLTGLSLQLSSVTFTDAARMADARRTVAELAEQVRQLSMDLRPAALDTYGLLPALRWHIDRYTTRTGVTVDFRHEGVDRRFAPPVEITAYRVIQEALTNIARHAYVNQATVQLLGDDQILTIVIRDKGSGFDPAEVTSGSGLGGMRERVTLLGGTISIDAAPEGGVVITAELPIDNQEQTET